MRVIGGPSARWGVACLLVAGCYQGLDGEGAQAGGDAADDGGDGLDDDGDGEDGVDDDGDGDDGGVESLCDEPSPGASPIRRLTAWEYDNTVRDLLGDATRPSVTAGFPQEGGSGFDNNADVAAVTWLMANKYMLAAEDVAERASQTLGVLLPCDPFADEAGCIAQFVPELGRRAWRRPLTDEEVAAMLALFADARAEYSLQESVSLLLQAFLQSPYFLYRVELGVGDEAGAAAIALDDWEMASRLSYFLWGSMPDEILFDAAASGQLRTRAQVETQARRLLDHPRARAMVAHFHEQWLAWNRLAIADKDPETFPDWNESIAARMHAEAAAFVEHVVFEGDGTLHTLLTAPYTFVDPELAAFYGMPEPPAAPGGAPVLVEPQGRPVSGVLTQGGPMSVFSKPNQTSPIARGLFVREHLLCQIPPPPPDDIDLNPPQPDPDATTREQYEQHRSDPACSGCHMLFDPVGFGFEAFDAIGRHRTTENGAPIDATGELIGADVGGEFDGVVELGELLADSEDVADCVARQWFRYANGRTESAEADACNLDTVGTAFTESGHDIRELLVALTQADSFMFRTAYAAEGGQ